jgi:hypothetical protein
MSQRNGQKARANVQRKARVHQRSRIRQIRAAAEAHNTEALSAPANLPETRTAAATGNVPQ